MGRSQYEMEGDVRAGMRADSSGIICHEVRQFRTRWHRWLGQKCRIDKAYWATLLNSNWMGWATGVLAKRGSNFRMRAETPNDVKELFSLAITLADMGDLCRLDGLYIQAKLKP